jgi:uncharacterized membrane protein YqiK
VSSNIQFILIISGIIVIFMLFIGFLLSRMYRRASKEIALVRTGWGGEKVATTGGLLVFPVLHQVIKVRMNTLKLTVGRKDKEALITKDRLRVDVSADFYLRVKKDSEAVANAAQTLGELTHNKDQLKQLMEGKFVDALRAVAAVMTMDELHEKRSDFVQQVQDNVSEELNKNGLELETVSLVGLDQTAMEYFDPNNAFDAEGLKKLTEITESRRKQRNDIEKENAVEIARKNKDAEMQQLSIKEEEDIARAAQEKIVSVEQSRQAALTKMEVEEMRKKEREAEIRANEAIEAAEIKKAQAIEQSIIEKQQHIEAAEINKRKAIELSEQEKAIEIAHKSEEQSLAEAKANEEKAKARETEEKIVTAVETEKANREKAIAVIKANEEAEEKAVGIKVAAEAEKEAAISKAEAVKTEATAQAEAVMIKAEADEKKYRVDAEGKKALNEAKNALSSDIIRMTVQVETIRNAADIIKAASEPMKSIQGIKITQLGGLDGLIKGGPSGGATTSGSSGSIADQIFDAMLKYRAMSPVVDNMLKEAGLDMSNAKGLSDIIPKFSGSEKEEEVDSELLEDIFDPPKTKRKLYPDSDFPELNEESLGKDDEEI